VPTPVRSRYGATGAVARPGGAEGDVDVTAPDPTTALIVIDVQNDLLPGGALAVHGGDRLAPLIEAAATGAGTLVATRQAHPADHLSFADRGGRWSPHCVAGSDGADLHASVAGLPFDIVQETGVDRDREQCSGFDGTALAGRLRERGVRRVVVAGVAADDALRATALDAIREGFETAVLTDAVAFLHADDGDRALAEIRAAGGRLDRVHLMRDQRELAPLLDEKAVRLRAAVEVAGRERAVIGLSGGIDSAVSLAIAARALGPDNVTALRLPSRHTERIHLDDAAAAAAAAGLPAENVLTASIEPMLEGVAALRPTVLEQPLRFGNASARCRMIAIYDLAQELHALVVGTENRSEYHLGYFTRFGDAASDVEPIWDLYKTEVRIAARVLGQPESVITKHPTAGLWGGQTDEDELGFSYHDADLVMVCVEQLGMTVQQTAERTGVPADVVERVSARIAAVLWKHSVPHAL
jgi:NAD+ synthase